jgi:hypothetical protein
MGCEEKRFYLWPFLFLWTRWTAFQRFLRFDSPITRIIRKHSALGQLQRHTVLSSLASVSPGVLCPANITCVMFGWQKDWCILKYRIDFISPKTFWSWSSPRARVTLFFVFGNPIFHYRYVIFYPSFHVRSFLEISQITGRWHNRHDMANWHVYIYADMPNVCLYTTVWDGRSGSRPVCNSGNGGILA